MIRGEYRARLGSGQADIGGARGSRPTRSWTPNLRQRVPELAREYRALLENLVESRGVPQVVQFLRAARTPGHLADLAATRRTCRPSRSSRSWRCPTSRRG